MVTGTLTNLLSQIKSLYISLLAPVSDNNKILRRIDDVIMLLENFENLTKPLPCPMIPVHNPDNPVLPGEGKSSSQSMESDFFTGLTTEIRRFNQVWCESDTR